MMDLSIKIIHLYLIAAVALFITIIFSTEIVGNENPREWTQIKMKTAISCGTPGSIPIRKSHQSSLIIYRRTEDREGNGCSHSWGTAGAMCAIGDHKRWQIKVIV